MYAASTYIQNSSTESDLRNVQYYSYGYCIANFAGPMYAESNEESQSYIQRLVVFGNSSHFKLTMVNLLAAPAETGAFSILYTDSKI